MADLLPADPERRGTLARRLRVVALSLSITAVTLALLAWFEATISG